MRTCSTFVFLSLLAGPALATISIDMYASDGNTPLALRDPNDPNAAHVYRDIMVGTRLCIVVSSDNKKSATGSIKIPLADLDKGEFTLRAYNPVSGYWDGCLFSGAGSGAQVRRVDADDGALTSSFRSGRLGVVPGKWFIWDYEAKAVGVCHVFMYDLTKPGDGARNEDDVNTPVPEDQYDRTTVTLNHVPTRDFNGDTRVNFKDFALLARQWRTDVSPDPNGVAGPFDFDGNACVAAQDLCSFSRFWLDTTDARVGVPDPNAASPPQQP